MPFMRVCMVNHVVQIHVVSEFLADNLWLGHLSWHPLVEWARLTVEIPLYVQLHFLVLVVIKVTVE
jgi:hypothetical protein